MKGLLKNNLYGTYANAKAFSYFMVLFGIFAVAVVSQEMQIYYVLIGILGFSGISMIVVRNEFTTKWGKYKLTLPVKRADIVKSQFLNHLIWLLVGTLFAGMELSLSWFFHGYLFDLPLDILSMFAAYTSLGLFMGAIFFPMFYMGNVEMSTSYLLISLLCALGIVYMLVSIVNDLLEPGTTAIVLGAVILIVCSLAAFGVSYSLTVSIFKRKEF